MWGGGGKATPASGSVDAGGAAGEDDELTRLGKNVSKELPADELATLERKVSNPGEYDLEGVGFVGCVCVCLCVCVCVRARACRSPR